MNIIDMYLCIYFCECQKSNLVVLLFFLKNDVILAPPVYSTLENCLVINYNDNIFDYDIELCNNAAFYFKKLSNTYI